MGELGVGDANIDFQWKPTQIPHFDANNILVKKMVCGQNFVCVLSDSGTVFCWGDNSDSQCAERKEANVYEPSQVDLPTKIYDFWFVFSFCFSFAVAVLVCNAI